MYKTRSKSGTGGGNPGLPCLSCDRALGGPWLQAQLNALETKLERRLDEITQLLGGTPSGR